ncbi:MAG: PH domain-containing protein [Verrucomicrobiae bacterium]|nr:PH domain-containing protein [Verrucomicrobiae bacterium]
MVEMRFTCPGCGKALKCDAKYAGSPVKCPECETEVLVPRPKPPEQDTPKKKSREESTATDREPAPTSSDIPAPPSHDSSIPQEPRPPVTDEEPAADSGDATAGGGGDDERDDEADEEDVDEAIAQYLEDDQPAKAVHKTLERIAELLKEGETVEYIAVQHNPINPLDNIDPGCVVVTSRRLILCRPKMLGRMEFRSFAWYEVTNLRLAERIGGTTLAFKTITGEPVSVDLIPKKQARHLYTAAQRCEEIAREERRLRTLEQSRAHAEEHPAPAQHGNPAHPPGAPAPSKGDPLTRLKRLKEMLDLGLITQEDYAAKKQELLAEL